MEINLFKEVIEDIQYQFNLITDKVIVCDEQIFFNDVLDENKIYAVVKFGSASSNFAQVSLPFTLQLWSLPNEINITKDLLLKYATTYNIHRDNEKIQFYSMPVVVQNFTQEGYVFRALYYISGQFIFGTDTLAIEALYFNNNNVYEKINFLSAKLTINNTPNTQPFPDTLGLTKTVNQFSTFNLGISTYLTKASLIKNILINQLIEPNTDSLNTIYKIKVKFTDSDLNLTPDGTEFNFKLISFDTSQSIGGLPTVSIAFTL